MHGNTVRWGICSAGKICQDFANNLLSLPRDEHQVEAVAASSLERAKSFADKRQIPRAYGSYQELANDPDIDVVYIGSINTQHFIQTKMMLEGGKSVLCEKPFCMSVKEEQILFDLAKEKKLFLMEAIWSRCSPVYDAIQKIIEDGEIGEVKMVRSDFGINVPAGRVAEKELGGGALFDLGIYSLQLSQFIFKDFPTDINAVGFLNEDGVDVLNSMTFKYTNKRLASMNISTIATFPNDAIICGSNGFIRIHRPFWTPDAITVNGQLRKFPMPNVDAPMHFDNSQGLTYEAQEVRRCLLNKWLESPRVTHAMSIEIAQLIEHMRKKLGYSLPQDDN